MDGLKNISNSIGLTSDVSMHFKLNEQAIIPMVIFCSYRPEYTAKLVHSLKNLQSLNPQTPCLFVLHRGPKVSNNNVRLMNTLLKQIDCCKVIKWIVNDSNKNRTSKTLKRHWYRVVTRVFEDPGKDKIYVT